MMSEDDGPDPNDVRRHAKKMHTEREYRLKYCSIDFYRPNRKQMAFHSLDARETMLRAGNQLGKTHAVGAQMTFDALGIYPDWYVGRRIGKPPAISRSVDFMGWATCTTSATTRDGVQTKLFGDITQEGGLGTGLVPLDHIGKVGMARGISGFIDTVSINRIVGGVASVRLKTYEMGREAFQAVPVDRLWLDEDTKDPDIYGECLARLTTTRGRIYASMTPMRGLTPMRRRFKSRTEGTEEVLMTIYDAAVSNDGHIPDGDIPGILAGMSDAERQTRAFGADMQGEGAVFETPIDRITYSQDPSTFPPYWRWLWAFDFRHSGSETTGHPFAAVLGCRDLDTDTIYVVHALRMKGLAPMHVAAIKSHPMREAPVAWPHDGGRGASLISGETVMQVYRRLGMNMLPTHATFAGGGYNFEAGIDDMRIRFSSNRLKIAAHLSEVLDEYQGYHLVNGLVNKIDDDLLSAIRVLCMDIRRSKAMNEFSGFSTRRREGRAQMAEGVDFDVFSGGDS
jgi:phage terminase large subunit-like protein